MPFSLRNLKHDLKDVGSNFDGAPELEFRLAPMRWNSSSPACVTSASRPATGSRTATRTRSRKKCTSPCAERMMKLDDKIVELREWDAVRVPPGTWRGYEAGADGLEIIVIGTPNLGENPRADVDGQRDWWTRLAPE